MDAVAVLNWLFSAKVTPLFTYQYIWDILESTVLKTNRAHDQGLKKLADTKEKLKKVKKNGVKCIRKGERRRGRGERGRRVGERRMGEEREGGEGGRERRDWSIIYNVASSFMLCIMQVGIYDSAMTPLELAVFLYSRAVL